MGYTVAGSLRIQASDNLAAFDNRGSTFRYAVLEQVLDNEAEDLIPEKGYGTYRDDPALQKEGGMTWVGFLQSNSPPSNPRIVPDFYGWRPALASNREGSLTKPIRIHIFGKKATASESRMEDDAANGANQGAP